MSDTPKVGEGATIRHYSDRTACTIVRVSESGKTAWIQEDNQKLLNGSGSGEPDALHFERGGFVGHTSGAQRWKCTPNPEGRVVRVSLRKNGIWRTANNNEPVTMGSRHPHYDFNF